MIRRYKGALPQARRVRELSAKELEDIPKNAEHYIELARSYAKRQHGRDVP